MTSYYAVEIHDEYGALTHTPLYIDFFPDESSGEATYVRLSKAPSASRKDSAFIASIPVRHPAGVILTHDNWAGFLYCYLSYRDKLQIDFGLLENTRGCRTIRTYPSFGQYCFIINSLNGKFGILVDRPAHTPRPLRSIKSATIIQTPYSSHYESGIYYDDFGLCFKKERAARVVRPHHDVYQATFKEPMTNQEILSTYIGGWNSDLLHPDLFCNPTDEWDLKCVNIGGFQYFVSEDGEVIFTLHNDPIQKAFHAVQSQLSTEEFKHLTKSIDLYRDLVSLYAMKGDTPEGRVDFLKSAIEILEWSRAVDG